MRGRLVDLTIGLNRKQRITVEVDRDYREDYERLKDAELDIEIKKHREKRSKSANAYFHVLVNKIAAERGGSDEATKASLVVEYGALAKDADGLTVGFKLPASVDVSTIYPYVKCFDTRVENGKMFKCYLVYKQTHLMDSKEMARLIDGAIEVPPGVHKHPGRGRCGVRRKDRLPDHSGRRLHHHPGRRQGHRRRPVRRGGDHHRHRSNRGDRRSHQAHAAHPHRRPRRNL